MEKLILILTDFTDTQKAMLEAAAPAHTFRYENRKTVAKELIASAEIIIGNPPLTMLPDAKNLKLLALSSAGANQYCAPGILPEGVILTNATGAFGTVIAEWLLGMLMNIYNRFPYYRENQKKNLWESGPLPYTVFDSTVLIIGAGDIGSGFAKRVKALGGYTIGVRRTDASKPDYFDEIYLTEAIDSLLPRADVVALALPSTPETYHTIDKKRLALMKEDAVLLNVGRGTAIDTDALVDALQAGKLMGVGLDVTDPEPLPADHPLWQIENAYITPHISGGSSFSGPKDFITEVSAYNIKAILSGTPLRNVVDIETGYRKLT